MSGKLEYWVKSATQLEAKDIHEVADPYCVVYLDNIKVMKTKYVRNTVDPVWDEKSGMVIKEGENQELKFQVYDKDRFTRDDFIGEVSITIAEVIEGKILDRSLVLMRNDRSVGYLHVQLKYNPV